MERSFENNLDGRFMFLEPAPEEVLLSPRDRWMGLVTIFVGLLTIAVGIAYVIVFIWSMVSLTVLAESFLPYLISSAIVSFYCYMLLLFEVTSGQVGSVGKSGFTLAIVGVGLTGVGCFANLSNPGIVGNPLNILGISIPLVTIPGLLARFFALFFLQHAQTFWQLVWRLLPGSFIIFVVTICGYALIDYVKGLVSSSVTSVIGQILGYSLTGLSWLAWLAVLSLGLLILFQGAPIVDLGRLLSFGKEGSFKHKIALTADGHLRINSEMGGEPGPPIAIYVHTALIDDNGH
jgi:hypothetical protein